MALTDNAAVAVTAASCGLSAGQEILVQFIREQYGAVCCW